jgi:hypothetical protein
MTMIIFKPAVEINDWEQQARAAARITDSTTRYFAARSARSAGQAYLARQLFALTHSQISRCSVRRLYEADRISRTDALAPLGMSPA